MFKLDPFQQQAIDFLSEGNSVIVSAPTGAGKTLIAEHVIEQCMARHEKVIYTAPVKALSNQKYRDLQAMTRGDIGILTGDVSLNPEASVLIMTTEIFRNRILKEPETLKPYTWIIYDEIHYLDDYERGSVWEESLMFLPEHMRLLGLSATVPNVEQLRDWLESIHKHPVKIVKEENRPVPLQFYYQCQNRIYDDIKVLTKEGYRNAANRHHRGQKLPRDVRIHPNNLHDLIREMKDNNLLPCIYFVFSRRRAEELAGEVRDFDFLTAKEKKDILELYDRLCVKFDLTNELSARELRPFVERGVAYHHAGMLPTLKEVVEQLFTSRIIKLIFTTETFALGINMPARSVIFDELRKYYGHAFATLRTRDFYQMAGRAGRRSIDTEGHVFCRINPTWIGPDELHRVIFGKTEEVVSQFNTDYATVLNLYQKYGEKLYDIYPLSLHFFQTEKPLQKKALYFLKARVDILKEMGYIKGNMITPKGQFASGLYGYEFVLSELYEQGVLEKLPIRQLAMLCLAVVYEPRKGVLKPPLKPPIQKLEAITHDVVRRVHRLEHIVQLRQASKPCFFHLSNALEVWMNNATFDLVLAQTNADEGEVVRYFRMTVQTLKDMADGPVSVEFRDKLYHLSRLINRDVVDAEKQLRSLE